MFGIRVHAIERLSGLAPAVFAGLGPRAELVIVAVVVILAVL